MMSNRCANLYAGLLADAYDLYLAEEAFGDLPFWRGFIEASGEPSLELAMVTTMTAVLPASGFFAPAAPPHDCEARNVLRRHQG